MSTLAVYQTGYLMYTVNSGAVSGCSTALEIKGTKNVMCFVLHHSMLFAESNFFFNYYFWIFFFPLK